MELVLIAGAILLALSASMVVGFVLIWGLLGKTSQPSQPPPPAAPPTSGGENEQPGDKPGGTPGGTPPKNPAPLPTNMKLVARHHSCGKKDGQLLVSRTYVLANRGQEGIAEGSTPDSPCCAVVPSTSTYRCLYDEQPTVYLAKYKDNVASRGNEQKLFETTCVESNGKWTFGTVKSSDPAVPVPRAGSACTCDAIKSMYGKNLTFNSIGSSCT